MKKLRQAVVFVLVLSLGGIGYTSGASDDDASGDRDKGSSILATGVLGGLLGGGVGAAIGSASGHAGKGALIGAGVGAVGGSVVGASQADQKAREERVSKSRPAAPKDVAKDVKIKKRVVREYDEKGNVVSEKEI